MGDMETKTINMIIDGKQVQAKKGQTILDACNSEGIFIPTLCNHHNLPNFGACRLCLVKIDGMRGFPTSCTTPVTEDMKITTNDDELNELRRNIVEFLLSEHPNACIQCDDKKLCSEYRTCPMKAGQITGCQLCPYKENCELREVVEYLDISKVDHEFHYKSLDVERTDPFFDRDYNLCILCGRCVRVCTDIRGMGVLAFTQRGNSTRINTAFGKSHMEVGCGFCGACVDVCPTGSLSPAATKWHGDPDAVSNSICGMCDVNCGIQVLTKWGKVVEIKPDEKGIVNEGQLCAIGRFCIPTVVNYPRRLKYPHVRKEEWLIPVKWDEAVTTAVEELKKYSPDEVAVVVSPFMTNESSYLLTKFAREVIGTKHIVVPNIDNIHIKKSENVQGLLSSDWILVLSPRAVADNPLIKVYMNRAKQNGAKNILLHSTKTHVNKVSDIVVDINPSSELKVILALAKLAGDDSPIEVDELLSGTGATKEQLEEILKIMESGRGTIVYSSRAFDGSQYLGASARKLSKALGGSVGIMPLLNYPNERGVRNNVGDSDMDEAGLLEALASGKVKALWTTEHIPGIEGTELVILQDVFENKHLKQVKIVFPASTFLETAGSFTNFEGRVQKIEPVTEMFAQCRHDCQIVVDMAEKWGPGAEDLIYDGPEAVAKEMVEKMGMPESGIWDTGKVLGDLPFDKAWLSEFKLREDRRPPEYRGVAITDLIDDLKIVWEAGL